MLLFKPVLRAVTNGLGVVAGLWGVLVTEGFYYLFLTIIAVGIINLVVEVFDEMERRALRLQAEADRKALSTLVELAGARNVPANMQNLGAISDSTLKEMVGSAANLARNLEMKQLETRRSKAMDYTLRRNLSEDARHILYDQEREAEEVARSAFFKEYLDDHRPQLQALWDEVERRTGPFTERELWRAAAITEGQLAGPSPIDEAASILESYARRLSDD